MLAPPFDLAEDETTVIVRMDVPGVSTHDIDIQYSGNQLRISGERPDEADDKRWAFHRKERRKGRFSRAVTLPCVVIDEQISASFKDCVLEIQLPKSPEAKTHRIEIKG
ncbi:MAG: Hsp20/alpha crystallin family protein [Pirellulaceae bacterium]